MRSATDWLTYAGILLSTLVAALLLKAFVVGAVRVQTDSMEKTIMPGDLVLVNKLSYGTATLALPFSGASLLLPSLPKLKNVSRGDNLVFQFPGGRDEGVPREPVVYVKRCVAVGGDTLVIRGGTLYINGEVVCSYLAGQSPRFDDASVDGRLFPRGAKFNLDNYGPLCVPRRGDVIMMSKENYYEWEKLIRIEGHSVSLGPDDEILIDGKSASAYSVERNYIFVLGDNFYRSYDSRFWGFLPQDNVIGEAALVYWSMGPSSPDNGTERRGSAVRWSRIGKLIR